MEKRRKRHKKGSAALYVPIAALLVVFVSIFGVNAFMKVSRVEVIGVVRYTASEVLIATGISKGDNLALIDLNEAARRICAEMPYVGEVRIVRRLPDTIVIEIKEDKAVATVYSHDSWWLLEPGGRIVENTSGKPEGIIEVVGITPEMPYVGNKLSAGAGTETQLKYLSEFLKATVNLEINRYIGRLDISNIANVGFDYDKRFNVAFGSVDEAQHKLSTMITVIADYPDDYIGKIDMITRGKISVLPPD